MTIIRNALPYLPQMNPDTSTATMEAASSTGLAPLFPSPVPTYNDIIAPLKNMPSASGGADTLYNQGIARLTPNAGIDPSLQAVLDRIKASSVEAGERGASTASALASRRGLAGSSIEQFGVQTALGEAEKAARDAEAQVYIQDAIRRFQLQDASGKAMLDRSGLEFTSGANANMALSQAASDELASNRNYLSFLQQLELQRILGEQGINAQYANIDASKDIAKEQNKAGFINAGIGAILPGMFGGGGGGGGFLSNIFGGGGGTMSGVGTGATGYSSFMPGGAGAVGTGAGVGGGFLPGLGLAGLTIGGIAAYQSLGDKAKALVAPLVNPVNTVKQVSKGVSKAIKKVFPF